MKLTHLLSILALLTLGTHLAAADPPGKSKDFAGTYFASLPERAEILQLHEDGTAGMTLSDQVTRRVRLRLSGRFPLQAGAARITEGKGGLPDSQGRSAAAMASMPGSRPASQASMVQGAAMSGANDVTAIGWLTI
jgi:hypothetical protein